MRQYKSAQPAWVKLLTQASWADLYCRIEPAKMAEKIFGVGSCGRLNVIVAFI